MKFKTKPFKHQLDCLNRFGRHQAFALLGEMGTGKTWIIINNIADLWGSNDCDGVLIFAPNGVHSNWTRKELPKHMPDWCNYYAAAWSPAQNKTKKKELSRLYELSDARELKIFTMNWDALATPRGYAACEAFANCFTRLMIVCDESDAIKNPLTQRYKKLIKLKKFSRYRRIMTGTPINNSPFDAFSQYNFLDEHILGTTSFYSFKTEYGVFLQRGHPLLESVMNNNRGLRGAPQIIDRDSSGAPKYKNLEKLSQIISKHSFRVRKEDCLDLPEKIYKTLTFDLTNEQKRIYKQASKDGRLTFDGAITTFSKLVALNKLSQITSGYYIHPMSDVAVKIEGANPKLNALDDLIESIISEGNKAIIWAKFREEILDISNLLKEKNIPFVEYHGGILPKEREKNIDEFENGNAMVFVGNQQAGATGITLISARYVVYYSNSYSLRLRLQSEDRAHRIGQTHPVVYFNIVANGTEDEKICAALENKQEIATIIVDGAPMQTINAKEYE